MTFLQPFYPALQIAARKHLLSSGSGTNKGQSLKHPASNRAFPTPTRIAAARISTNRGLTIKPLDPPACEEGLKSDLGE
jgi:hypothetical protein